MVENLRKSQSKARLFCEGGNHNFFKALLIKLGNVDTFLVENY